MYAARALAEMTACVVVLKGSGTITAAPGYTPHINGTGNASLASGGTGDVLAGWLGGCWAQSGRSGIDVPDEFALAFATASQAVADHGSAAEPEMPAALAASSLIESLHRRRAHTAPPAKRR
jgi:NAD(P)H-hydrate repair Nnr-like enzyme with NAD(P)H-hydrate dehydratase domain